MDVENPNFGDCHKDPGNLTLERISECVRNAEETLATQSRVSGSRITARRVQPEQERGACGGPLHKSCTKLIVHLIEGAYREHCPDLMEFLQEELTDSQERQKALVKVGNEAGYGSPLFQKAVMGWRKSLDLAQDSLHQAQQEEKRYWPAATFQKTLEKVLHPEREYRKLFKRRFPDSPTLVDSYHKSCVKLAMQMVHVTEKEGPMVLLELLLEDLIQVQKRQQALFRAEMAAAMSPPAQKEKRVAYGGFLNFVLTGEMNLVVTYGDRKQARRNW